MTMDQYMHLSGWVRFRDTEAFEEWKRKAEENSLYQFIGDKGIRYIHTETGMQRTYDEAMAGELIRNMRDVGRIKAYKKLIDDNRIE